VATAIKSDRVDLRDIIFGILKRETTKEGLSAGGRARIKELIMKDINNFLNDKQVINVYFTRYEIG
jgi:flagellar basal body-associated protein FliL